MDNVIELHKINKTYHAGIDTQVLFDINLGIEAGSINAIIGQSGSGKSTLLNIIGTLDQPDKGSEVMINGVKTTDMRKSALAKLRNESIGFIFQFHYLLPEFTVLENVLMPNNIKQKPAPAQLEKAKELINLVGLSHRIDYHTNKISGGQQQRVAIARALMNNPPIILADEPTGNLDSKTTEEVYHLFCRINGEFNTTFVIITHDLHIAAKARRIIEIGDGRILSDKVNPSPMC